MYVVDATLISPEIKSMLEQNPFRERVSKLANEVEDYKVSIADYTNEIDNCRTRITRSQQLKSISAQKMTIADRELKHIEKLAVETVSEFSCDYLDSTKLEKFFNDIGNKFISLDISQSGNFASLIYVRPSRYIGSLPSQPYVITLTYKLDRGGLVLNRPLITSVIGSKSYTHPHVGSSSVCLGNYFDVLDHNGVSLMLNGYQDQVIMLDNLLSTYNPDSPYRCIDEIISDLSEEMRVDYMQGFIYSNDSTSFTFKHSSLSPNKHGAKVIDLIGEELFREYFAMLGNISSASLIEDITAYLSTVSPDSRSDDFDYMTKYESKLRKMFDGIELSSVDDFSGYDDVDDYYYIDADEFCDLKERWISELNAYVKTAPNTFIEFNFPDITGLFNKEEVTNVPF